MHLLRIKPLAKELSLDSISEKTSMHYLLVSLLVGLFTSYYSLWWGVVRDITFYFEYVILSIIFIFGCLKAYEANGKETGNQFVKKFFCLSVPVGIRVAAISIGIGLIINFTYESIFMSGAFKEPDRAFNILRYSIFIGLNLYYWWLLVKGVKQVKHYENET